MLDISFLDRREKNRKEIQVSQEITGFLLKVERAEAREFWQELEWLSFRAFKKIGGFARFKTGVLGTVAFMRTLKEIGFEIIDLPPVELDRRYGVDLIGEYKRKFFTFQLKTEHPSILENKGIRLEDLVQPAPTGFMRRMKTAERVLRRIYHTDYFRSFLITIPVGRDYIKENGEFSARFNKEGFISILKNSLGI